MLFRGLLRGFRRARDSGVAFGGAAFGMARMSTVVETELTRLAGEGNEVNDLVHGDL